MKSRVDLVTKALDLMGVSQLGQNAEPEDTDIVDAEVDGLLADLALRKIVYVADSNQLEDEWLNPIATILASRCSPTFYIPRDRDAEQAEEMRLRQLTRSPIAHETMRSDYF